MIRQYKKKPVVISAMQYNNDDDYIAIARWAKDYGVDIDLYCDFRIAIHTLEGVIFASPGDYVIKGVKDEFYPCKPDIFKSTYDEI
jgi:hypothetical protein